MKERPVESGQSQRKLLEARSWFAVVTAYQECTRQYTLLLQQFDLTVAQFDALSAIERLGEEAVPKVIAERLIVSRANITGLLRRLQERKLLELRAHAEDGRSLRCSLTPAGKALTRRAHQAAARFIHAQSKPFKNSELEEVGRLMREMQAHLQSLDPEALAAVDTIQTGEIV